MIALLGLLKFGKAGGAILSLLVSLAVYAGLYGWQFAVGFLALLAVHEMGHVVAARQKGVPVSAPTFIPFVGAWIMLQASPRDAETEAYIAIAGPVAGTVGATLCYWWARSHGDSMLLAVAYSGFFLNFFNLIPISPLDGGRITAVLSPRLWLLGAPMLLVLMLRHPSPLLVLIVIAAVPALMKAWRYRAEAPENRAYYTAPLAVKVEYGVLYLGLAAFLALMTQGTQALLNQGAP